MSEQEQQRSREDLRHEYTEVVQNIRHYSNMRFVIFSILFAVMGGVGIVAFSKGQFDQHAAVVARVAGILVIFIFWQLEEGAFRFYDHCTKIAAELERLLGYRQYSSRPVSRSFLPRRYIVQRVFYFLLTVMWLYAVFAVPLER
jgi:hypothetical protein